MVVLKVLLELASVSLERVAMVVVVIGKLQSLVEQQVTFLLSTNEILRAPFGHQNDA
jgi:Zn finger protein HypA/HybF involved in hydrogenase expression